MKQDEVAKRYMKELLSSMVAYAVILIISVRVIKTIELSETLKFIIALLPTIPIVFVILAIMRALRESDELQQRVQFNAIMFSAVTTGLLTFSYGLLENVGFPPFPTIWTLPIMFMLWGLSLAYFWKKYQ